MSGCLNPEDDCDSEDLPPREDDFFRDGEDEWGCEFPGQCCMPGPHMRSECHTAEMIREFNYHAMRGGR